MFYTMQITAEPHPDQTAVTHRPIVIETLTATKSDVTEAEIELVAEAFTAQIKQALRLMAGRA